MIIKYLVLSFLFLFFCNSQIQAQKIKFVKQKLPDELKSINDIRAEGDNLWIASGQGLYRYKNNKITRYYDNDKPEKLMINKIEIDDSENIWLSNYAGNLLKFKRGKIRKEIDFIGLIDNRSDILTDIEINKNSQDNKEILLTSSNGLILYYDPKIDEIGLKRSPVRNMIYSIHYGNKDEQWLCAAEGFYTKNKDKDWKNKGEMSQGYNIVKKDDKYWGVGRNKDNEAVFMLYYNDNGKKYIWKSFDLHKLKNKYIRFYDIGIVNDETIFIASNEGLIRYNSLTGGLKMYNSKNTKGFDIKDVRHITVQDENSIWLSSSGARLFKITIK